MKPFNHECMSPMEMEHRHHQMNFNAMREIDEFKQCITDIVEDYIKMIDTKISSQDLQIQIAKKHMVDNLTETAIAFLTKLFDEGKITLDLTYDPETESLYIGGELIE